MARKSTELLIDAKSMVSRLLSFIFGQNYNHWIGLHLYEAERGSVTHQMLIGDMYWDYGPSQDCREAVKWYCKAATQGSRHAQWRLGHMYAEGCRWSRGGFKRNYEEAAQWWRKAADQGCGASRYELKNLYAEGKIAGQFDQDWPSEASRHSEAAERDGKVRSMPVESELATEQENAGTREIPTEARWDGEEDAQRLKQLARRNRKAAKSGNPEAQLKIGKMHEAGKGAAKDNVRALMWYNIAFACGKKSGEPSTVHEAKEAYDRLSGKMTETQLRNSLILVHQWLESNPDWWD